MTEIELDTAITAMDIWHLQLPVNARRDHGIGSVANHVDLVVLALESDQGECGFGEASTWSVFTGSAEASFAALARYIRPHVLGRRLTDQGRIIVETEKAVAHCTEAKAALHTALLDLTGRLRGMPVWALLGGQYRQRIPLSCSIADPDFEQDKILMQRIVADGLRIIKLKTGFKDLAFDVMRLDYLCKHYPEVDIRVDYNQGLHPADAMQSVRKLAEYAPTFIEQPVRADQHALMADIRQAIDVPILADESVYGPEDMLNAINGRICDGVSVKIMKSGSLFRAQTVARMAAAAGMTAYGGDMFESGLAHLAGTHLIAATPEITLGCEFYQARYFLTEDTLISPFPIEQGDVLVPDTPGLGIDINRDILSRFKKQHVRYDYQQ